MKLLNLYACLGGNRQLWEGFDITAVEIVPKIAKVYQRLYPNDRVIVADAHEYLQKHYNEFDIIWSSPPCPSHSHFQLTGRNRTPGYPDLKLYEEIIFLSKFFKGVWIVENVVPYYKPLIPATKVGRHLFWSNRFIYSDAAPELDNFINASMKDLQAFYGIHFKEKIFIGKNHCSKQVLRNCVHPVIGKNILKSALEFSSSQITLF